MRFLVVALAVIGCAHSKIKGTSIPDTEENREIYILVGQVQRAMVDRNSDALLALISPNYFEDNGTARREDDYGFAELSSKILPESMKAAKEIHLDVEVHEIIVDGERAHADLRYDSRARLEMPAGTIWDSHREFDRIIFAKEDGAWRIVSGL
jgi:hypothetical protein